MSFSRISLLFTAVLFSATLVFGTIFGNVRGIVHDPQHRPIQGAVVTIHAQASDWSAQAESNDEGEFEFTAVPAGLYSIHVTSKGFHPEEQQIEVASGSAPILHFPLSLSTVTERVEVSAAPETINTESSASEVSLGRRQIAQTPGADRTNSLAMITDYLPGAYVVHDQLHVRGGHQVSWEVDGVPIPNTNIASNVGPQFDPKDVDTVELKRGGYSAEYGDRSYGVFNVIPRTGFEYDNAGELMASYGNFHQTNDQINFGSHTERFAYYGSVNANRSDLGLMAPTSAVLHDLVSGFGGFGSLIFNATPHDQLRLVASARQDHFQIPNTPDQQVAGIRDVDRESDAFVNFSWVKTISPGLLLTVSPFYHFNRADYVGGPADTPLITNDNRGSNYAGGQATLGIVSGKHNAHVGVEAFAQHDNTLFGLQANDGSGISLRQRLTPWGNVESAFFEDQYKLATWLTLNGGVRLTHYSGLLQENAADPRLGAALRVPKLGWVVRGFYGRYYQPPPLDTVSGPLETLAIQQGFGFLPLRGERDEEYEAGLTVPLRSWVLDTDIFRTHARNFFDHDVLGNSNIFLPLTIQGARVQGWEATLRSPLVLRRARVHVAYSHQFAEGFGAVSGGLTDFSPPDEGLFFLDHDQRNTLSSVISLTLPARAYVTTSIAYGSGFLNGDGPDHLPANTTFGVSLGKSFGENWSLALTALNAANRQYLLDNSNTFGGTHYAHPRQVYVQLRYRFHY
jgi:TonB dependent receptor-like, beta-barrel/Carboxypeptidase regulatory-like domain/TonB-dependent Receptor Plug Domain